jgi:uncharacterized protein YjeT (DUF2065 family)
LFVAAPGVLRKAGHQDIEIPPARLRAVGLAIGIGVAATLIVLAAQPNVVWLVESIRPYLL